MTTTNEMRPRSLDEIVGQETLKKKVRIAIGATLQRGEPLPHCLLTSAGGGLGKTTLAKILAEEMFSPLVCTSGQCLEAVADLRNILLRLKPGTLVLVDEFHGIGKLAAEELLLVLEERVINVNVGPSRVPLRIDVPPFTLIAATTKPEAISAPLAQRFGLRFHFEYYSVAEIHQIIERVFSNWFIGIPPDVAHGIARRSRGVPRLALRLSERVRDAVQAHQVSVASQQILELALSLEGIDDLGLSREERAMLQCLATADPRPVSARSLALSLGVGIPTVIEVLEPSLVRLGLMTVGMGGRRISESGLRHLENSAKRVEA